MQEGLEYKCVQSIEYLAPQPPTGEDKLLFKQLLVHHPKADEAEPKTYNVSIKEISNNAADA